MQDEDHDEDDNDNIDHGLDRMLEEEISWMRQEERNTAEDNIANDPVAEIVNEAQELVKCRICNTVRPLRNLAKHLLKAHRFEPQRLKDAMDAMKQHERPAEDVEEHESEEEVVKVKKKKKMAGIKSLAGINCFWLDLIFNLSIG